MTISTAAAQRAAALAKAQYKALVRDLADTLANRAPPIEWTDIRTLTDAEVAIVLRHEPTAIAIGDIATNDPADDDAVIVNLERGGGRMALGDLIAQHLNISARISIRSDVQAELNRRDDEEFGAASFLTAREFWADQYGVPAYGEL